MIIPSLPPPPHPLPPIHPTPPLSLPSAGTPRLNFDMISIFRINTLVHRLRLGLLEAGQSVVDDDPLYMPSPDTSGNALAAPRFPYTPSFAPPHFPPSPQVYRLALVALFGRSTVCFAPSSSASSAGLALWGARRSTQVLGWLLFSPALTSTAVSK